MNYGLTAGEGFMRRQAKNELLKELMTAGVMIAACVAMGLLTIALHVWMQ